MTGLHHMTNAIDTQLVNQLGYTTLWPMIALSNIAQGSAVLAMTVLQQPQRARRAGQHSRLHLVLPRRHRACALRRQPQVQVPAGLRHDRLGLRRHGLHGFGVQALSIGVGGLPGILSIVFNFWGIFAACMLIAIVVPFALTYFVGMRQLGEKDLGVVTAAAPAKAPEAAAPAPPAAAADRVLLAPLSGTMRPITEMPDPVFSSKAMGDGLAIEPAAGADTVVAPADATVAATMPGSNHAIGLVLDDGTELLVHVGVDTVEMGGDGFACLVEQGQRVSAGQPLMTFSAEKISRGGASHRRRLRGDGRGLRYRPCAARRHGCRGRRYDRRHLSRLTRRATVQALR